MYYYIHAQTRLLDVQSSVGRYKHEAVFYMVFEHMEQDLDQFIKQCPSPGMHESVIKVSTFVQFTCLYLLKICHFMVI